jgi:deazaflavin-dependent oxidoreductase (nitroreductase family)
MRLTTRGRRTGRPHAVVLWFASEPGRISLMAYARRHGRGTDWYRNLRRAGSAAIEVGDRRYTGAVEPVADEAAALTRITELFIAKYGRQMVNSYYTETSRFPVYLRITRLP